MNSEERREYNKKYYAEKKETILKKLFTKEPCELCGRMVTHQHIWKHRKSAYCQSRALLGDKVKLDLLVEYISRQNKEKEILEA
jgi:hypothetical protein